MTAPKPVRAVHDGNRIKYTLEQLETQNPDRVRCDWLRFTLPVDAVIPQVHPDMSWVEPQMQESAEWVREYGMRDRRDLPEHVRDLAVQILAADGGFTYMSARSVSWQGAIQFMHELDLFNQVASPEASGMDFYAARTPLLYGGCVVGYVLAGGRDQRQSLTVHFNLFGAACLHLTPAHLRKLADWIDAAGGWITRCDLALDVWSGLDVSEVQTAWRDGLFDVRGKRPGQREMGSWSSGHSRTFEVGSRGTGKLLRAYEKGDELFGVEAQDPWVRLEVEFRSSHRVVETDVLRRPADFFAGAYPWLAAFLAGTEVQACPQKIPTHAEVKDAHADAAVSRVVRWVTQTAGPALAAVFSLGGDILGHVIESNEFRQARRLRGFDPADIRRAFDQVAATFAPSSAPSFAGA
jgi:phage replication initiation protein